MSKERDPAFEEGPFFYISEPVVGQLHGGYIIWATDAHTARSVFGWKTNHSVAYIYPELIGSLSDLKKDYKLTPAQVADLHRDGFVKIQ